jgi:hypothetical protein
VPLAADPVPGGVVVLAGIAEFFRVIADYTSRDKASLSSGRRDRSRQSLKQGWNQRLQIRTSYCPALLEPKAADDIRPPTTRVARAASATDEHFHASWIRGSAQWTNIVRQRGDRR